MKLKLLVKCTIYTFLLILPIIMIAGVFHTCLHFNCQIDKTSKIGNTSSGEDSCLACRIERQGTSNQPIVSFDLDAPILLSSIQLSPYAFIPQAFSPLQENRAPPLAA